MAIVVEAVYEDGVFKPVHPLPLKEQEHVRLTVETRRTWVEETAGLMGFQGTEEAADYFALSPELDYPPPPEEP